jgi:hypothetical protein
MRKRFWKDFWWDLLAHPRVLMLLALGLPAISFLAPWAAPALLIVGITFAALAVVGTFMYLAAAVHVRKKLNYPSIPHWDNVTGWMEKNKAKGVAAVAGFFALVAALTLTIGYIADPFGVFSFMAPVFNSLTPMFANPLNALGIPISAEVMAAIFFILAVLVIFDTIREMLPYGGAPLQESVGQDDEGVQIWGAIKEHSARNLAENNDLLAPSVGAVCRYDESYVDYYFREFKEFFGKSARYQVIPDESELLKTVNTGGGDRSSATVVNRVV